MPEYQHIDRCTSQKTNLFLQIYLHRYKDSLYLNIAYRFFVAGHIRGDFFGYVPDFWQYRPTYEQMAFKLSAIKPLVIFYEVGEDAFHHWGRAERRFVFQTEVNNFSFNFVTSN